MAIEPIEKLTRPLSRKEEKRVAWDAPEDYLKRAVEQFIIEFPEFEDLQGEDLYKEMEKKGWFSDQYASGPDPGDMSGWYEMYDDLKERGELPDWMDSFDIFMENLDVLDISPMDFTRLKGKKEKRLAMSDPDPMAERFDMMDILAEKYFGKRLKDLTDDEVIELEENWDELISQTKQPRDIRQVNQGGIIGLRNGGDPRIEQQPEGIMQLASHSGNDVIQSAILWAAGLPQFGSIDAVVKSLEDGSTDINGLVNAYMDARTESN